MAGRSTPTRRSLYARLLTTCAMLVAAAAFAPAGLGAVTVTHDGTEISVSSDGAADVVYASCPRGFLVLANGMWMGAPGYETYPFEPAMPCAALTALTMDGGGGDDTLNAAGVSPFSFPALSSVTLSGGAGDDSVGGPGLPALLFGGDGDDGIEGSSGSTLVGGDGRDTLHLNLRVDGVHTTLDATPQDLVAVGGTLRGADSLAVAGTLDALTVTRAATEPESVTITGRPLSLTVDGYLSDTIDASSSPRGVTLVGIGFDFPDDPDVVTIVGSPFADSIFASSTKVNADGRDGPDTYSFGDPTAQLHLDDTGTSGSDELDVFGTSGADSAAVSGDRVVLDAPGFETSTATYGGVESLLVDLRDGGDAYRVAFDGALPATVALADTGYQGADRFDFDCPANTSVPGVVTRNGQSVSYTGIEQKTACGPPPTVTGFSPSTGVAGASVSIAGTNLAGATGLTFGGAPAQIVSNTVTKIVARVPADAPVGVVAATTSGGTASSTAAFKPIPRLTAAAPSPAQAGDSLTLTGSNLLGATVLKLGSRTLPIASVDSAIQLTTGPLPDSALTGPLTVATPGGTSAGLTLGVRPTIAALSTDHGAAGAAVTLTGKTFTGTKSVTFGGAPASFKVVSATTLATSVPAAAIAGPIAVTNAGGATQSATFTVLPQVTGYSPSSGVAGTAVSIAGTGLGGATDVSFGGVSAQIVSTSATKVVARVPASAPVGIVGVTTSGGAASSTGSFKPVPKLTAAAPAPARAGDALVLTGSNLLAAATLRLGSLAIPVASIDSATQLTSGPLPDAALTGALTVGTPGGTSAGLALGVRPTIASLSASAGPAGTVVTLTGKTFTGTKAVTFGGAPGTFKALSATRLTATVPAGALSGPVTVTNAGGSTQSDPFQVLPRITGFTPATASRGSTVTITGTGLGDATAVRLNGVDAASFEVVSASRVTALVGPDASTGPVSVTTPSGTATSQASLDLPPFTLRVNLPGFDLGSIDPNVAWFAPTWQLENTTCAKLLGHPDSPAPAGSAVVPEVAEALPAVSDEGKTYTFAIRPGFRFSPPSGQAVTAQTFKFTIERAVSPNLFGFEGLFLGDIVGALDYMTGTADSISGIVADGNTLRISLVAPAPDLLARLAVPMLCAVPTGTPLVEASTPIASAGPYYVSSYTPGSRIVLDRNPDYGGARSANPDHIVYAANVNPAASLQQVLSGQADFQYLDGTSWPSAVKKAPKQTFANPFQLLDYLALNTSRPVFSTVAARRAVNLVVNRTQLAETRGPAAATPTDQYLPLGMPGFRDASIYPLDGPSAAQLKEANSLVNEAGIRGRTVVLYTCNNGSCPRRALLIRSMLARIGLRTDIRQFPFGELFQRAGTLGEPFDMVDADWGADYADPTDFLNRLLDGSQIGPQGNGDIAYFDDPAYNAKLQAAAQLSGPARDAAYGDLDIDLATNAAPWIAYDNRNDRNLFSARIGCQTYQPEYGMDLATLCLK